MQDDASQTHSHTRRRIPSLVWRLAALGAAVFVLSLFLRTVISVSAADIELVVDGAGLLGPIAYSFVLTLGLVVPFNPVSDLLTVHVAALLFEPEMAIAGTFVAHTLALILNYGVARRYGQTTLKLLAGERVAELVNWLGERLSYKAVFLVRLMLPLTGIGIDVVSYLAGMQRLGFTRFYVASIVPWTLVNVLFFTSTAFFLERAPFLFFLPAVVLVLGGGSLILVLRRGFIR